MVILAFPHARSLAQKVGACRGIAIHDIAVQRYGNDQRGVDVTHDGAAGEDVCVMQDFSHDLHGRLMELLFALDTVRRLRPRRLTAILPYLPYTRSDVSGQVAAPAMRTLARLLCDGGVDRLITATLHTPQVAMAFDCPVLELDVTPLLADAVGAAGSRDRVVIAPDFGGAKRAARLAAALGCGHGAIQKIRTSGAQRADAIWGTVERRAVVLLDDEINTATSLVQAAELARNAGARSVSAAVTHNLLTAAGVAALEASGIEELFVTDSLADAPAGARIHRLGLAPLIAEAMG